MRAHTIRSGRYRIDLADRRIIGPAGEVHVAPLEWSLLHCLLTTPGSTVTKHEIAERLWPDTPMSEYALSRCVRRLRTALGDDARRPRFVQTVHGVGFRWIAAVDDAPPIDTDFVGRVAELDALDSAVRAARSGRCTTVVVEGPLGSGKTRLIERFVDVLDDTWQIGRSRCHEPRGLEEPYGPLLDAIEMLVRNHPSTGTRALRTTAPTWLAQLPDLVTADDRELMIEAAQLGSRRRMLRELLHLLAELAVDQPVLIVIDDLHWADAATVDAIRELATTESDARLLIVLAIRTADLGPVDAPDQRASLVGTDVVRIELGPLAPDDVSELVRRRFVGDDVPDPDSTTDWLLEWTAGNPLFVAALLDHALHRTADAQSADAMPTSLNALVDDILDRLAPRDQQLVEALAVAGTTTATVIADVVGDDRVATERRLGRLVSASSIAERRPSGFAGGEHSYDLAHAAYRQRARERVGPLAAERIHHTIATSLASSEQRVAEPGVVAQHFVLGGDRAAAITFWLEAARIAIGRFAHAEALRSYELVLDQVDGGAEVPTPSEIEARLGAALCHLSLRSRYDERSNANIERLNALVAPLADRTDAFTTWRDVLLVHNLAGRADRVRAMAPTLLRMAQERGRPDELMDAHHSMGEAALHAGDLAASLAEFERADAIFTEQFIADDGAKPARSRRLRDTGSRIKSARAGVKHLLGRDDEVPAEIAASQALSQQTTTPLVQIGNATICASILLLIGDDVGAARFADRAIGLADAENEEFVAVASAVHQSVRGGSITDAREIARTLLERPAIPFPLGPRVFVHARLLPRDELLDFVDEAIERCATVDTHWCDELFATARKELLSDP